MKKYAPIFILVFACISTLHAADERGPSLKNASELTGELLIRHAYLFEGEEKGKLDTINRRLRQLQNQFEKSEQEEKKSAFYTEGQEIISRLFEHLKKMPILINVTENDINKIIPADVPIEFPGDLGSLLFRVTLGEERTRFVTVTHDFAEKDKIQAEIVPDGETWILVSVLNVPENMTTAQVELAREPQAPLSFQVRTQIPQAGRLKVSVLSSDTGKPVSSMIRMIWKANGQDRKPSNALEFAQQMDHQGNPSGRRVAQLPGRLAGPYWCVPKPFDMSLPPGEWEITVRRGVEHVPVFDTITIVSGKTVEKTYQPRRWVDMRHLGWYSGDDHVHCQIRSDIDAERLLSWVKAEDIHVANVVKMGDIYRTWFEQCGWGKEYRVTEGDTVLSPGQECPRTHTELGHTIHMNTQNMVRNTDQYFLYDLIFDEVHKQGGLSGYCHVLFNMFQVHRDMSINIPKNKVDFIELMQFNELGTDLFYDFLNLGFKMTASAGSDVPWGGTVGEVRMYAYIGERPFSADAWFDAIRKGHTYVTNGPMIELKVNGAIPGDEVLVDQERMLHVRARAWGDPERMVPVQLDIISQGEIIRSATSDDPKTRELLLDFNLPARDGFWIAAKATGSDESEAHTTPIYVIRPPLRFWKHGKVDELIDKRLKSLQEVDELITDYTQRVEEGKSNNNRAIQVLAALEDQLRERVVEARKIYNDLRIKAIEEDEIRNQD